MKLKKELKDRILNDNIFSLQLAMELNVRQEWVLKMAKKDSKTLLLPPSISFFKQNGYSEKEIIEN
ncbi:hypothetical protein ACT4R9_05425 [Ornithobacterium rhinotracheale]|uniref:hypothetical protein n=1 Tax=Ornithobacterium rhinotracheale TaxID=28251 RepID=UPI00129C384F|nr:hypothetical protein [Ornithobacterium rhinotracheale]MRJ07295.1 hypothetical protein [Ornithobacterium rhinotracheale]UOH77897.1 hypothetical protein MT996_00145 [Ornithobacterium rhinotracheale]